MRMSHLTNRAFPFAVTFFTSVVAGTGGATVRTTRHWVAGTGYRQLTLNNDILTCLLVPLTAATDFVGQTIAFVVEGLAALTTRDTLPQLALDKRRLVPGQQKKEKV